MKKNVINLKNLLIVSFLILSIFILPNKLYSSETIDNETCLDCHDEMSETLKSTSHQLNNSKTKINCVSCHGGAEIHIEDPSVENIGNPQNKHGYDAISVCSDCHNPHIELDNIGYDVHQSSGLNCSSCHQVHGGNKALLLDSKADFCVRCHKETETKFARRSNHPVKQNILTCLSCHKFTKKQDNNYAYDFDRICQDCHPAQGGPFLFEHEAVNGYSIEGSGCINCHDPHGSENDRLLKQKGNEVCRQCHIEHVTTNHALQWETNWSKLPCQSCHTDTHGSFVNHQYLDPNLDAKFSGNCYDAGCHARTN